MSDQTRKIVRLLTGRRGLKAFVVTILIALTGCFGAPAMHYDIQEYNKKAVSSEQEMLLYNIGRLHYGQPPHFMMLSTISQSRSFSAGGSFQWGQLWNSLFLAQKKAASTAKGADTYQAGLTAGTSKNPTIQFVPIQGQDFAQRFESSLTDKFTFFLEDRDQYTTAAEKEAIVLLFTQSLVLSHGDDDKCKKGVNGLYVNRRPNPQDLHPHATHYYSELSECVKEIVESYSDSQQIDSGYPVPTNTSEDPKATDVVAALQQNLEWTKKGGKFVLTKPVRIPAWFDYDPKFVSPPEPKPQSGDALPPVWSQRNEPQWHQNTGYFLPKGYAWKKYQVSTDPRRSAEHVYALVPDGYDLARDENGDLRSDRGHYIPKKTRDVIHFANGRRTRSSRIITTTAGIDEEDVGSSIAGMGIPAGTTILAVNAAAKTATMSDRANANSEAKMSVGDADRFSDRFSYGDEVVHDVWPFPQDYFYVELRRGEVDDATAERICHSQTDKYDYTNNVVCGYFKIGNLLQIMQRLAGMACTSKEPKEIEKYCPESTFGIGPRVPSWADSWASYTGTEGTEWIWTPAHDPETQHDLAERDRVTFFNLYKLYQMSLVDTSKLVTGAPSITIPK